MPSSNVASTFCTSTIPFSSTSSVPATRYDAYSWYSSSPYPITLTRSTGDALSLYFSPVSNRSTICPSNVSCRKSSVKCVRNSLKSAAFITATYTAFTSFTSLFCAMSVSVSSFGSTDFTASTVSSSFASLKKYT